MAPPATSEKITLSYPVMAADFLDANRLLVCGGGGYGSTGVPNKISLLDVSKSSARQSDTETLIAVTAEHELPRDDDAPMSLAVAHPSPAKPTKKSTKKKGKTSSAAAPPLAYAGINSSIASQKAGKNEHFRTFAVDRKSISPVSQEQFFDASSGSTESYQRLLRVRGRFAAVASGGGLGDVRSDLMVLTVPELELVRRSQVAKEIKDADVIDNGEPALVYCTDKDILYSAGDAGSQTLQWQSQPPPPPQQAGSLRCIRFLRNNRVVVALNHPRRTGAEILLLDPARKGHAVVARKRLRNSIKQVSAMDVANLGTLAGGVVALAGGDQSITLLAVDGDKLSVCETWKNVHPAAVSTCVFSPVAPDTLTLRLATGSIANTVVVHSIPVVKSGAGGDKEEEEYALARSGSVGAQIATSLLALVAVAVFAVLLQVVFTKRSGLLRFEQTWEGFRDVFPGGGGGAVLKPSSADGSVAEKGGEAVPILRAGSGRDHGKAEASAGTAITGDGHGGLKEESG